MAWNEPDGGGDKQDPWGGRRKSTNPPDLDKLLSQFQKKLSGAFGQGNGNGEGPSASTGRGFSKHWLIAIGVVIIIVWASFGFFIVKPAEQAVILRFGKYIKTVGSGPHWVPPLIDAAYKVNEQQISKYFYSADMLTKDENIVSVAVAVQYRKADAEAYLFNVVNPEESLQQATASALRQVVGNTQLALVLTSGREVVREQVQEQLVILLKRYKTGLEVTDVALQSVKVPEAVKEAFDDATKAQEDAHSYVNQAEAYAKQIIPAAEGKAKRYFSAAAGYKEQVVLNAKGEVAGYLALLPQYLSAPGVTRERLYMTAMETVLQNSTKVLVDISNSNNVVYIPLEKLLGQTAASMAQKSATSSIEPNKPGSEGVMSNSANIEGRLDRSNSAANQGYLAISRDAFAGQEM